MYFGTKNAEKLSLETFDRVKKDVEKEDLEKSVGSKKEKPIQESFHGHVWSLTKIMILLGHVQSFLITEIMMLEVEPIEL